jgi:hypothetical protein
MHCVAGLDNILVNIGTDLKPPNLPRDEHLLAQIVGIPQQIFKIFIILHKKTDTSSIAS